MNGWVSGTLSLVFLCYFCKSNAGFEISNRSLSLVITSFLSSNRSFDCYFELLGDFVANRNEWMGQWNTKLSVPLLLLQIECWFRNFRMKLNLIVKWIKMTDHLQQNYMAPYKMNYYLRITMSETQENSYSCIVLIRIVE